MESISVAFDFLTKSFEIDFHLLVLLSLPHYSTRLHKAHAKLNAIFSRICNYNWVVMTVFRIGAFGLLLVVTTSDETSHGDTIAASTTSIFGVPLLFWSF